MYDSLDYSSLGFVPSLENSGLNIIIKSRQPVIDSKRRNPVFCPVIFEKNTFSACVEKHQSRSEGNLIVDACLVGISFPF